MSKPNSKPILITMGEPAGIGPEVAVAAHKILGGRVGAHPLRMVGDKRVFQDCGFDRDVIATRTTASRTPGKPSTANNDCVTQAIEDAVAAALRGDAAAIVTAPINKAVLMEGGFKYPGHTEFLEALTSAPRAVMMLASDTLRVVPQTIHVPLTAVPGLLSTAAIVETGEIILAALKRDFGIAKPRLTVAGLNPHAGEDGELGKEDGAIVAPAVAALRARGHDVRGPLSADTLFHAEARAGYDAALCMYHDQALIPIKTLSFWDGVNVTLGLPIVRTSPDHGTAFDIAGTGKADARSMIAAIQMAAAMADARG
jgi:4-hydroxythreonine-4-phosphate dehydrogenase